MERRVFQRAYERLCSKMNPCHSCSGGALHSKGFGLVSSYSEEAGAHIGQKLQGSTRPTKLHPNTLLHALVKRQQWLGNLTRGTALEHCPLHTERQKTASRLHEHAPTRSLESGSLSRSSCNDRHQLQKDALATEVAQWLAPSLRACLRATAVLH